MVLVTGSGSLIGKSLVAKLQEKGEKVRCLVAEESNNPGSADFIAGDVLNGDLMAKAMKDVDAVYHIMDRHEAGLDGRMRMRRINIRGAKNVMRAAAAAGVGSFYLLSSWEVCAKSKKSPIPPDAKPRPGTRFGRQKLKAENICRKIASANKIKLTIFRTAKLVGPETEDPLMLITMLMAMGMGEANRYYIGGSGNNRFQLIHPDDAASAMLNAYKNEKAAGKIYNLGSDNVPTQLDQADALARSIMKNCAIKKISIFKAKILSKLLRPFRTNYLTKEHVFYLFFDMILDTLSAREELGWRPQYTNMDILEKTIKWYAEKKLNI